MPDSYIIIGAGAFGSSTALELVKAGHSVTVLERSSDGYHSPDAASNDLNKIIRADYSDEHYRDLAKSTISLWRRSPLLSRFYHETGVLLWSGKDSPISSQHRDYICEGVSRAVGKTTGSLTLELARDGEVLPPVAFAVSSKKDLMQCFPITLQTKIGHLQKQAEEGPRAYYNARGGWADADKATRAVLNEAKRLGARVYGQSCVVKLLFDDDSKPDKVTGVQTNDGSKYHTEGEGHVIVCTGAWASGLLRNLLPSDKIRSDLIPTWASAQCVVAIKLDEEQTKIHSKAPVVLDFTTGFYCFEPNDEGIMKIAIHDKGYKHPVPSTSNDPPIAFTSFTSGQAGSMIDKGDAVNFLMSPKAESYIPVDKVAQMFNHLTSIYPHLANSPIVYTRICFYSESHNEDWIIDHFPGLQGLMIVSGDSGHGFKFLPVIGQLVCARLGLPSVPPLTAHQNKVFSFEYHDKHVKIHQTESNHHRGQL